MKHLLFPVWAALAAALPAQLEPHHAVVGTVSRPDLYSSKGKTGIFFVPLPTPSLAPPTTPVRLAGVPSELEIDPWFVGGVASVQRTEDGRLVAGGFAFNGQLLKLYVLTVSGTTVTSSVTIPLGRVVAGVRTAVSGIHRLPGRRFLVGMANRFDFVPGSGIAARSQLGILDLSGPSPVMTEVPMADLPAGEAVWDVVAAKDGKTAWLLIAGGGATWSLNRVDMDPSSPTNGQWWRELTLSPSFAVQLCRDHDDHLHLTSYTASFQPTLHEVDPTTSPITVRSTPITSPAIAGTSLGAIEPATGGLITTVADFPGTPPSFAHTIALGTKGSGVLTVIARPPAGGWSIPFALDVYPSYERYGADSPRANRYRIADCPALGGLPVLGNQGFEVTVRVEGNAAQTPFLALATDRAPVGGTPVAGVSVLLRVPFAVVVGLPMGSAPARFVVPVPNTSAIRGLPVYAQGIHLEGGGLAASDAVRIVPF